MVRMVASITLCIMACSEVPANGALSDECSEAADCFAFDGDAEQATKDLQPKEEVAAPDAEGPSCDELEKEINAAIIAASKTKNSCTVDSDCTLAPVTISCKGGCHVPVAKAEQSDFKGLLDSIQQKYCHDLGFAKHCSNSIPSCVTIGPHCVSGHCGK